jgi:hypothetical protein
MLGTHTLADFQPGNRVVYVPTHAEGDLDHPDCEYGVVSSTDNVFVFVRYWPSLEYTGWNITSQATSPEDLVFGSNGKPLPDNCPFKTG